MRVFSFEKLESRKLAKNSSNDVDKTSAEFSPDEKYGIKSQLRRAALSIVNNLEEETSRKTYKDKLCFVEIEDGSLLEVVNILIICKEFELVSDDSFNELRNKIDIIGSKLSGLKRSFEKNLTSYYLALNVVRTKNRTNEKNINLNGVKNLPY